MYKTLFILVFCLSSSSAKADWLVNYQEQTRSGVGRVELNLQVLMPAGKMPADALLIVNSSAGRNDNVMQALGKQAQTQGIAAVLLDTYGPRGINDTMSKQNQLSYTQQLADIFAALNAMRNDPRFKDRKIALAGHSRGGILTYTLAHQDFAAFWEEPILAFDAFVALSPDCLPTFPSQLITAPLFIVSGENDDWTRSTMPATRCTNAGIGSNSADAIDSRSQPQLQLKGVFLWAVSEICLPPGPRLLLCQTRNRWTSLAFARLGAKGARNRCANVASLCGTIAHKWTRGKRWWGGR